MKYNNFLSVLYKMPFIPPSATCTGGQPDVDNIYLIKGQQIPSGTVLTNPVPIESSDGTTNATLFVNGEDAGAYQGSINIQPGANATIPGGVGDGMTIRTIAGTAAGSVATTVEIGANAQGANHLYIAGLSGVGEVYDEVYNQPVSLQPLTITQVSATNVYDSNNPGEFFRCTQAGVAASVAAAIGCVIQVPRTGWYMCAIEIDLANAPAPAPISINTPINAQPPGYINVGETLQFSFVGPQPNVTVTPYGNLDVGAQELAQSQNLSANDGAVRQYTFMQKFDATQTYRFLFKASSPVWNIGAAGQIKAELIAMC